MADIDEWGGVPVDTQPKTDEWGGVPVSTPKLPDLSGVQNTVQQNLSKQQEGEGEVKTQTTQQKLDTAAGMPVSSQLNGSGAPLSPEMRAHLVDSYKAGTASNGGDFMQSALLPIAMGVDQFEHHPLSSIWNTMQQGTEGSIKSASNLETDVAAPFMSDESLQRLQAAGLYTAPAGNVALQAMHDYSGAAYGGLFAPIAKLFEAGTEVAGSGATAAGIPAAAQSKIGSAFSTGMDIAGVAGIPETKGIWDDRPGSSAMKETVGEALGKSPAQVTSADINQTIAKSYDHVPAAQDFHDAATVMNSERRITDTSIIDKNGEPLKVYHGTASDIKEFDTNPEQRGISAPQSVLGVWFTDNPERASSYAYDFKKMTSEGGNIIPAYLDIKNPYTLTRDESAELNTRGRDSDAYLELRKRLESEGYDGVIVEESNGRSYVAFHPEQIHSAIQSDAFLKNKVNTLHDIYTKTGVKPDQVFEDAKSNPSIAADISAVKIPSAYDHLIDTRPPIPDDIQKVIDNYKPEENSSEPVPTSKEYAESLYNRLHEKLGEDTAADIQSMQRELSAKDALGKDLDQKFYLKKEDESIKLSDEEQKLYDEHIKPLAEQERALYEKARTLSGEPIEPSSESYVHRIARGKGHYLDKYDAEFGSDDNVGFGTPQRSLSQSTSSLKEAEFHTLQDADGNRELKIGKIPEGYKAGDKYTDDNGKEWTIKRAKTAEIEKNTDLQYHKSAIGNTEDNIRKLEKTIRNIEFLNDLKGDMKRTGLGIPADANYHQNDYKSVNIPQLRGWSFDPRVAEVLNDIYDRGGDSMLGRVNNFLIKGMFLNPIPHIENVFYDYLASRGWKNANLVKGADYITQGIRDVKEFTPEYIDALKNGAALKLPAVWKGEFFNQLQRQFLKEAQSSKEGLDLAKSWGFDSVPSLAQSVFNGAQKALWGSGDAFLMAKIRELKDTGMSTEEAIKDAQKHIVDYRIPPRVGENILGSELSRMLSKTLQGNAVVVFTRYHYGLFKSLGNMVKDTVNGIASGDKEKSLEAASQLFSTFFLLSVVNPLISKMWSGVSGEKEKVRRPGITGLVGAISDLISGKKNLGDALSSQAIVSPGIQVGSDILKDKIINPDMGYKGVQLMDYLMKQPSMSVPSIPYNIREGKQSTSEEALRQIGVTPDKQYQKRKPSRKSIQKLENEEQALLGNKP